MNSEYLFKNRIERSSGQGFAWLAFVNFATCYDAAQQDADRHNRVVPPRKAMSPNEHQKNGHQEKFRRGVEQFNARQFFEAHETWEEIWLASPEPEKTFLQGIIQIAAAFHHYGRGNTRGTRTLLEAGLKRLDRFPPMHNQLALDALRAAARSWSEALSSGSDLGSAQLPKIAYARRD